MPSVLIILADGCEEIEVITPADVLVRAGAEVVIASVYERLTVTGSRGIPLGAHTTVDAVSKRDFDVVYVPGGKGSADTCRTDVRVQERIRLQVLSGRWLACICAASTVLIPHGLHRGRRLTSFPTFKEQFAESIWLDQAVVVDGHLVTSQAAGTSLAFALTLVSLLFAPDHATSVARQMLANPL